MKHRRQDSADRAAPDPAWDQRQVWPAQPGPAGRPGPPAAQPASRHLPKPIVMVSAAALVLIAIIVAVGRDLGSSAPRAPAIILPSAPRSYLGLYERGATTSYTGVNQFARAIGRQPNLVSYYSGWGVPFQTGFAAAAVQHGAVPLVQIDPESIPLSAIASGRYDSYLRAFADAVRSYQHPVVIGFGHEMNAWWYSWGYPHASAQSFVAAWRHIVTVFRAQGAWNATWMWTINVIGLQQARTVRPPGPWWPGSSYVTWVGIDGYYFEPSWTFAPLFGPTIKAVRALTHDPILISETAAGSTENQPAKIADLFAGTRAYGLLGFVWFNVNKEQNWRVTGPAAVAAFRRGARTYRRPQP
ncbi:MAG TPA: glycosyl hydrolase [Streptosporangiaceae bacterium]|nr:glycosyl hydrolase [Streptosporangiaceae bacterium]